MPIYKKQYVASDAQAALIQYVDQFEQAFAMAETPWAVNLGAFAALGPDAIQGRFPLDLFTNSFEEFKGDPKFESIVTKYVKIDQKAWQAGSKAKKGDAMAGMFSATPQGLAMLAAEAPNAWVTSMLEGSGTCDWDGLSIFNDSHLVNPFDSSLGTFDNLLASTPLSQAAGVTNLNAVRTKFRSALHPDGKKGLGLDLTHIMVPPALANLADELAGAPLYYNGTILVNNSVASKFQVIVNPRLTSTSTWYAFALNNPLLKPWGVVMGNNGTPEVNVFDESSEHYKLKHELLVNAFLDGNVGCMAPHTMIKCTA